MDGSEYRRGKPCWYKVDNIGTAAINDGIYLESCVYTLIKQYCRGKPYYLDVMELFHDVSIQCGQVNGWPYYANK